MKTRGRIPAKLLIFGYLGTLGLATGTWLYFTPSSPPRAAEAVEAPVEAARRMCRHFIRGALHDPASAEWMDQRTWPATRIGGVWEVRAIYRAKNPLGATVLQRTECKLTFAGDTWTLVSRKNY